MFENNLIILAVIFILLLTIIMFGLANSVLKMSFGPSLDEKAQKRLGYSAYIPQIIFLILLLAMGIFIPGFVNNIINKASLSL
jgi:hypothetical protein